MKHIIKGGKVKTYKAICPYCGCEFTFNPSDGINNLGVANIFVHRTDAKKRLSYLVLNIQRLICSKVYLYLWKRHKRLLLLTSTRCKGCQVICAEEFWITKICGVNCNGLQPSLEN